MAGLSARSRGEPADPEPVNGRVGVAGRDQFGHNGVGSGPKLEAVQRTRTDGRDPDVALGPMTGRPSRVRASMPAPARMRDVSRIAGNNSQTVRARCCSLR